MSACRTRARPRPRAAASCCATRAAARRGAHLAAAPGDPHRRARAGRRRPALDPGPPVLAAQRAALRRAAGQGQDGDPGGVRRRAVHALAPVVRRRRRRRSPTTSEWSPGRRPAVRRPAADELLPRTECLADVVRPDAAVLVRRDRARTCGSAGTVLVAAHGNSLRALVKHLDGLSDEEVVGLNIPTGIPLRYELDDDAAPGHARRRLPRPGRRRRRHRGRQEPGPLGRPVANFGDWQFATYLAGLQGVRPGAADVLRRPGAAGRAGALAGAVGVRGRRRR